MDEGAVDLNRGVLAPVADEVTLTDLEVSGRLPPELDGTLIRNGPNPFDGRFEGNDLLSWWVGPAMLHGLRLTSGRARWYRNRWVRTGHWARFHQPDATIDPARDQNTNVHLVAHAGSLLALGEGGLPFLIDGWLNTVGPTTLRGALFGGSGVGGMTAHPKVDPERGELRYFRADWQAPYLRYGVLDRAGRSTVDQEIEVPAPAMMHDFAATEQRCVFLDLNVAYDFELLQHGAPIPLRWHDERPSRLGIIDRLGGPVTWVEIEPCFVQHVVNAYDEGPDALVLDVVRYPSFLRFDHETAAYAPNPLGVLWRYRVRFGPAGATVEEGPLDDRHVELPRIDERRTGRPYRYAYVVEQPSDTEMRGLARYDVVDGGSTHHRIPEGDQNSEPVFVARPGAVAEDD
ncbi:MAG: carotenoid oxygenase family protein, partial [Actinomycetota bacterium]